MYRKHIYAHVRTQNKRSARHNNKKYLMMKMSRWDLVVPSREIINVEKQIKGCSRFIVHNPCNRDDIHDKGRIGASSHLEIIEHQTQRGPPTIPKSTTHPPLHLISPKRSAEMDLCAIRSADPITETAGNHVSSLFSFFGREWLTSVPK